ncbi:MAG: flagellar biosynthesis protein FliQ [Acetivibrio ethanolgignens]
MKDMTEGQVIDVARETLWIIIKVSAPLLLVSLMVGLAISIFQTVTSIQEQTLTFVPKLLAIFLVIVLTGNWMMKTMVAFLVELFSNFGNYI